MTLLCVPIMVREVAEALDAAQRARDAGADLVEYRLDESFSGDGMTDLPPTSAVGNADTPEVKQILALVSASPLPCIVTCRPVGPEGGSYDGDDMARVALFERLGTAFGPGEHPPRYLDVELATLQRSANIRQKIRLAIDHPEQVRDLQTSLIVSSHDFKGRPADLSRRLAAMHAEPSAKVRKIAFRARSLRDNLELFDLIAESPRPTIALGMGEFGLMSRVLAPKFNGFLTFAALTKEAGTAPGQPTLDELLHLYRFRSIGPATQVLGVVGYPISHSLSPHVHNAGFAANGVDAVYLPLPIAASASDADDPSPAAPDPDTAFASLKATLLELLEHPRLNFRGCSVTIPHKESLVRLARDQGWSIDPFVEDVGAANTLIADRDPAGRLVRVRITNTDVAALVDSLAAAVGDLKGKRAAILGAGGVARAASYGLSHAGATVVVYNRTRARADELVESLRRSVPGTLVAADLANIHKSCCDLYINATPAGMKGGPLAGRSAIDLETLRKCPRETVVMDTVYNPIVTPMLEAARSLGLRTVDGASMFARQAEAQFHLFTGSPPPTSLFDRIARDQLSVPRG